MIYELAIDTSNRNIIYFCIWGDKHLIKQKSIEVKSNELIIILSQLLNKKIISNLKKVYLGLGPGSLTSCRIGLSFIKGLCSDRIQYFGFHSGLSLIPQNLTGLIAVQLGENQEMKNYSLFFKKESSIKYLKEISVKKEERLNLKQDHIIDQNTNKRDLSLWKKYYNKQGELNGEVIYAFKTY